MNFIKENQAVIMVVFFAVVIAVAIAILVFCSKIYKNFYVKKFSFTHLSEREDGMDFVTIIVSNKSLNDMTVSAMGFSSGLTYFDYIREFRAAHGLGEHEKVIIPARSSVQLRLRKEDTENEVLAGKKQPPKRLSAYVIDSYGGLCKAKVRGLHKLFKSDYKAEMRSDALREKNAKAAAKRRDILNRAEDLTIKRLRDEKLTFGEKWFLSRNKKVILGTPEKDDGFDPAEEVAADEIMEASAEE